jgi:hypothetical protein
LLPFLPFLLILRDKAQISLPQISANASLTTTDEDDFGTGSRDRLATHGPSHAQAIPWLSIWKSPAFLVLLYNHFAGMLFLLFLSFFFFIFSFLNL